MSDSESMLSHTNPLKHPKKIKSGYLKSPVRQPIYLVAFYLLWWFASIEKGMATLDTECRNWDKVSPNNKKLQNFISVSYMGA